MADSKEKLIDDVTYVASTLDELDFTVNWEESEFQPSHTIEFLGFQLNSKDMMVKHTRVKADKIRKLGLRLL